MRTRKATENDIDQLTMLNAEVQQVHIELYPDIFNNPDRGTVAEWFEEILDDKNTIILVSDNNVEITGYIIIRKQVRPAYAFIKERRCAYIDQVCIAEKYRKTGIFHTFMEETTKLCREWGMGKIELDMWTGNAAAAESFRKCGFKTYNEKMELFIPPAK